MAVSLAAVAPKPQQFPPLLSDHQKRAKAYAAIAAKKFSAKPSEQPKALTHVPVGGKAALKDATSSYDVTPPRTMGSKSTAVVLGGELYVFRQSITSDHGPAAWYDLGKAPVFTTSR